MTVRILMISTLVLSALGTQLSAQTTEFTYQGSLKDGAAVASGNYDFEFRLFDAVNSGTQLGSTIVRNGVGVSDGIFSVTLDFGTAFTGADRFLEIRVRNSGGGGLITLDPRQKLTSAPYAVKSINADNSTNSSQLGGVAASQFVQTNDPRLSDARDPLPGSNNYIRNSVNNQPGANLNIGGDANINGGLTVAFGGGSFAVGGNSILTGNLTVNGTLTANLPTGSANYIQNGTTTQAASNFSISGNGVLGGNLRAANVNALSGFQLNSTRILHAAGTGNLFAGYGAGDNNTGSNNTFVGIFAGVANSSGSSNTFVGRNAGVLNTTGNNNAAFGDRAGDVNSTGSFNSFFGGSAGGANVSSSYNSFFGYQAGLNNTSSSNAFFGAGAGSSNTSGNDNSFFGRSSGVQTTVGIGNTFLGKDTGFTNMSGSNNTLIGSSADTFASDYSFATAIGAGAVASSSNSISLGRGDGSDIVRIPGAAVISGTLTVGTLSSAGSTAVCLNLFSRFSPCSSSLRYKTNITGFTPGIDLVKRLRPITFDWKEGGMHDLGLGAEDVAAIEPLLVTYNKDGWVEGVKYDRIGVVLINAVVEQQKTIEAQQAQIEQLKKLVCLTNHAADICKE